MSDLPVPHSPCTTSIIQWIAAVDLWPYDCVDMNVFILWWAPLHSYLMSIGPSGPMVREQWHSRNYFSAMTVSLLQVAGPFFRTQDMNDITFLLDLQKTLHTTVLYYEYQKYTWSPCKGRSGWVKDINGLMEVMNGMVVKSLEGGCYDSCIGAYRDST